MSNSNIRSFVGSGYHQGSCKTGTVVVIASGLYSQVQRAPYKEASPQKHSVRKDSSSIHVTRFQLLSIIRGTVVSAA